MPEPDWMMIAIGAAAGVLLVALPLWLLLAGRARAREGVLDERLTAAEARATELKQALDDAGRREQAIVDARATEAALRAAAEEKTRRIPQLERELEERARLLDALRIEVSNLRSAQAELNERLAQEQKNAQEKLRLLDDARSQLADAFKALSSDALKHNNQSFVTLARETLEKFQQGARDDLGQRQQAIEQLTKPIRESLEKVDHRIVDLEKAREGAYRSLEQQVKSLLDHHLPRLHKETADLVKALRQPTARGRWGEMQLRRVVEMAGMLEHCDFSEQQNVATEGGRLRPDMIVRLPGGRQIVVDAKAPVDAYLSAVEAGDDAERQAQLVRHARQLRTHIEQLGRKSYFEQFEPTPEFVVLFVPGEAFFSAALAQDAGLIEYGTEQHV
ncbi:MAG: DNA recombination protein RmuC, partial [Chromatiales bacterium]|nr:DNA recombination protein RmuC [Chromatiales bacterium]